MVKFDFWAQTTDWNGSEMATLLLGLNIDEAKLSIGYEAALAVFSHCLILQRSKDSTNSETQGGTNF